MLRFVLVVAAALLVTAPFGETVKCYHCYESYNTTLSLRKASDDNYGAAFVRCDKNKLKWNTYVCPANFPSCVVMSATVNGHYEVVRSCAKANFCEQYVPPNSIKLQQCTDCNSDLCNDYPKLPEPPEGPGPKFVFNININMNLKKYPLLNNETLN